MRKDIKCLWLVVVLAIAAPTIASAQTSSMDAPNTAIVAPCVAVQNVPGAGLPAGPRLGMFIKAVEGAINLPNVRVNPPDIGLAGCDNGTTVVNKAMDATHAAAIAAGYTCNALAGVCGGAVAGGPANQIWNLSAPGKPCGFQLNKAFGAATTTFTLGGMAPDCNAVGQNIQTNAGNPVAIDLFDQYGVGVKPNGFPGLVQFSVFHSQGGANPRTFTVNTASFTDDLRGQRDLHDAIRAGFVGTGLGLVATVQVAPDFTVQDPADFNNGPIVVVSNVLTQSILKIQVQGVPGQIITQETSSAGTITPALNPWGVTILVAVMLLTGLWFLKRRARHSTV